MQGPRNDNAARRKRVYVQSCIIVISASTQEDVHWCLLRRYHQLTLSTSSGPLFSFPLTSISGHHSVTLRDFDDRSRCRLSFRFFLFRMHRWDFLTLFVAFACHIHIENISLKSLWRIFWNLYGEFSSSFFFTENGNFVRFYIIRIV